MNVYRIIIETPTQEEWWNMQGSSHGAVISKVFRRVRIPIGVKVNITSELVAKNTTYKQWKGEGDLKQNDY